MKSMILKRAKKYVDPLRTGYSGKKEKEAWKKFLDRIGESEKAFPMKRRNQEAKLRKEAKAV